MSIWIKTLSVVFISGVLICQFSGDCRAKSLERASTSKTSQIVPNALNESQNFPGAYRSSSSNSQSAMDSRAVPLLNTSLAADDRFAISSSFTTALVAEKEILKTRLNPEISISTTSYRQNVQFQDSLSQNLKPRRNDRYRDTIPAVFRLTLKGYSIVEYQGLQKEAWTFNKVRSKALRKPEIMFSFTKRF